MARTSTFQRLRSPLLFEAQKQGVELHAFALNRRAQPPLGFPHISPVNFSGRKDFLGGVAHVLEVLHACLGVDILLVNNAFGFVSVQELFVPQSACVLLACEFHTLCD